MDDVTDDELLNLSETSGITRIPVNTLRFMRSQGTGPKSFRLGRRVFYKRSDVLKWIDEAYARDGHATAS